MVKNKKKETVFVGMSGGVDSSVSAAILKGQGYNVIGVFMKTWHPDFLACNEEDERIDAMRVCAHLDIPFLTFDFEDVYKKEVADYMISEYKFGRTPNPDVMCNRYVKFGAFLKKAILMGADCVATGHYAIRKEKFLLKGIDPSKDQSYFLWTLKQEQLSKILFPIGHLEKTEVRKLAKKFKIPVAEKKDSQGICFLGQVDLKDFLKHYIKEKKGKVFDESKNEIGYHEGVVFYTLGERHGFVITKKGYNDGAYYVIGKDTKKNILYVSQDKSFNFYPGYSIIQEPGGGIKLKDVNWIYGIPKVDKNYTAQIRYHGEFFLCNVKINGKENAEIVFKKPVVAASGQSVVVYDKNICLGGGIII